MKNCMGRAKMNDLVECPDFKILENNAKNCNGLPPLANSGII